MTLNAETLGLSSAAFALLRDLVHERSGLFFDNQKSDILADKLAPLVIERGLASFLDYYCYLKYEPRGEDECRRLMDALAVPETYFWREFDQIHALVHSVVPKHFASHPGIPLRIWSAACSTGEEPLTIAMALEQSFWFDHAPIEIVASDASPAAIAKAQRGVYRERSFRAIPLDIRERYFTRVTDGWEISPDLSRRVQWCVANMKDSTDLACSRVVFLPKRLYLFLRPSDS